MNFYVKTLALFFILTISACGDHKIPGEPNRYKASVTKQLSSEEQSLLLEIDRLNDLCRGSPDQKEACDAREELRVDAEKANWCWGPISEIGANQRWIRCSDDPSYVPKREWFAHDINHANCMKSMSPADRMRGVQEQGRKPVVRDLASGAVEVEVAISPARSEVWTFFPSESLCIASLPKSAVIDSKYE